jgi:ribosomal-protein-alanine N-acetyltransferase
VPGVTKLLRKNLDVPAWSGLTTLMPLPTIKRIDSPRLMLRPAEAADLPELLEINGDPEVTRFLPYPTWQSLQDGAAWLARMEALVASGTAQQLVVVRRSDSRILGTLLMFKYDEGSSRVELGYALGRRYWGQGIMREAITAACAYVFGNLGVRRIEAEVNSDNRASCALLLRVGFTFEGTLRKRWVTKGIVYDTNIYGRLAEDGVMDCGAD